MNNKHLFNFESIKEDDHQALRDLIILQTENLSEKIDERFLRIEDLINKSILHQLDTDKQILDIVKSQRDCYMQCNERILNLERKII